MAITSLSQLDLNGTYSYADYLLWQFQERVELLKGRIWQMSPAPSRRHQTISGNISRDLYAYFRKKECRIFVAPFDVRLYNAKLSSKKNKDIFTVVQPDICIICNAELLDDKGCNGAPDLIIEILSPNNSKVDLKYKYALYAEAGVKEYWIVYPDVESISQFILNENNEYQLLEIHVNEGFISPYLFPELQMDLTEVFEN